MVSREGGFEGELVNLKKFEGLKTFLSLMIRCGLILCPPGYGAKMDPSQPNRKNSVSVSTMLTLALVVTCGAIVRPKMKANDAHRIPSGVALAASSVPASPAARPERNPERNAYFGETHQHTSWSFDAYIFGNHITGPADSYKYYMGETIKHPLAYDIKIDTPMDFAGVTDHSEYAGVVRLSNDPSSPLSKMPFAKDLIVHDAADIQRIYLWLGTSIMGVKPPIKELMDPQVAGTVWKENNKVADEYNKPGKFTAFCAYEWTSNPDYWNMHRNIFFQGMQACARPALQFVGFDPSGGSMEVDGRAAQGRKRTAGHLA